MFSEDKFNELMKNLKAGKEVPTPKPDPVPVQRKGSKKSSSNRVLPSSTSSIHTSNAGDIGNWLNQVDSLRSELSNAQSQRQKLATENVILNEKIVQLSSELTKSEAKPDLSILLDKVSSELAAVKEKGVAIERLNHELREKNDNLKHQLEQARLSLKQLKAAQAQSSLAITWNDVFKNRGLVTTEEIRSAVKSLLENDFFMNARLSTAPNFDEVMRFLDVELCLSSIPSNELPMSYVATVSSDRCEIGGGKNINDAIRSFIDSLLVCGCSKILIIGTNSRHVTLVRHFVQHHAIDVLCIERAKDVDLQDVMDQFPEQRGVFYWDFVRNKPTRILETKASVDRQAFTVAAPSLYSFLMTVSKKLLVED